MTVEVSCLWVSCLLLLSFGLLVLVCICVVGLVGLLCLDCCEFCEFACCFYLTYVLGWFDYMLVVVVCMLFFGALDLHDLIAYLLIWWWMRFLFRVV